MEHVKPAKMWKRALVAMMCAFTLSFSMMGTAWADLSSGRTAGEDDLSGQATVTTDWPFNVYLQYGEGGTPVLVKSYADAAALISINTQAPTEAVSALYKKKNNPTWQVATSTSYVTLEDVLKDAGVDSYWKKGATLQTIGEQKPQTGNSSSSSAPSFTYESLQNLKFYPDTDATSTSTAQAKDVPTVIALNDESGAIDANDANKNTAGKLADTQKTALATGDHSANAPRILMGVSEEGYVNGDNIFGNRLYSNLGGLTLIYEPEEEPVTPAADSVLHRLYNPNSGEHFFTSSDTERDNLMKEGWTFESDAWTAPEYSKTPVYRLYNAYGGEHHYTTSPDELTSLTRIGWSYEGIAWYSDDAKGAKIYRVYNPYAFANNHHYTTSESEAKYLIDEGWSDEGVAFYGLASS